MTKVDRFVSQKSIFCLIQFIYAFVFKVATYEKDGLRIGIYVFAYMQG